MFAYIINPRTNIKYKINSNEGINILKKYLNYLEDGHNEPCALNTKGTHCIKSKNWDKKYCKRALNKNKDYCKKTKTLVRKSKTYITPCSANQTEKDCVDQDNCTYNTRKGCIENRSDKDDPCKMYHNNPKICKRRNCIYSKNGYCRKRTTKKTSSIRKDSKKTSPKKKIANHSKRLSAKSYYNTYGLNSLNNKCNNKCLKLIGDKNIPPSPTFCNS